MPAPRGDQLLADQQSPPADRQDLEALLRKAATILITKSPQRSLPKELSAASPVELRTQAL